MNPKTKGALMLLLTAAMWSTAGVIMKGMSWTGPQIGGIRSLIAALTILFFIKRPSFRFTKWRVLAIIAYAATVCSFAIANKLTSAANAILLQYTAPIYSALLGAWLLRERVRRRDVVSIFCILGGMVLFVLDGLQTGNYLGDAVALLSGAAFGSVSVFTKLEKDNDPAQCMFWGNLLSFFAMLPFMGKVTFAPHNVIAILVLGIFQLGIPYVIYTRAVRYVSAVEVTIVTVSEAILNTLWVLLFLGIVPSIYSMVGGAILILTIVLREVYEAKTFPLEVSETPATSSLPLE